ncbi:MAG: hypothetical protein R3Y58_06480 [Eubacteriales bacterium]
MSISDIILLNFYAIKPLVPCIIAILAVTTAAFFFILAKSRGLWFNKKNFNYYSIFVELNSTLAVKLACVWVKLLTISFYLIAFTQLEAMHYVFLLIPCVGILLINVNVLEVLTHAVSIAVQFVGVLAANILCSYIRAFELKATYLSIYVLIAILIILYSIYIFFTEIDLISSRRSIKIEKNKNNETVSHGK